jgi:TATA-binding protein-associated factor Taf7
MGDPVEYITAREFESRMGRLETTVDRVEGKVDRLLGQRAVIVKKTALHATWITPLIVAVIEALKAVFR